MLLAGVEDVEPETFKPNPKEWARLAGRLLVNLEYLPGGERARIWARETRRRETDCSVQEGRGNRPARDALRAARAKLK
jgi:hypothetical protein